ncbi:hypothetical protein SAMD00019534_096560 [Acytostelium subglobosum LB1]|uniref:hypothetical protein n=1 Tax=Acytostelium subglobosum LB1 TaxID=1410327 RepID=UPI0006448165|nr:hypothetical protein SAMD00019534_096560 [Acytostelium subglobosum LB1]GAM26481.1 hypothetical protein SAMD00019534_096560 [Acytostelium subglobosum LB1]|eukprot:XP_012750577.1 hypothetical protein SAMD00019534_096560 [Acytostelium subglobosum LB1]
MSVECQSLKLHFIALSSLSINLQRIPTNSDDYTNVIVQPVDKGDVHYEFPVTGRYNVSLLDNNGSVLWQDVANVDACGHPAKGAPSKKVTILIIVLVGLLVGFSLIGLAILNHIYKRRSRNVDKRLSSSSKSAPRAGSQWSKYLGIFNSYNNSSSTKSNDSSLNNSSMDINNDSVNEDMNTSISINDKDNNFNNNDRVL